MARVSMGMKNDNKPLQTSNLITAAPESRQPDPCCTPAELATCCEPEAKATCCAKTASPSKTAAACGCR
jgi:hypothetical protein